MSEDEFKNTFDYMDFWDEGEWSRDDEYRRQPELLSDLHSDYAVSPLDRDVYEWQELDRFEPMINFWASHFE